MSFCMIEPTRYRNAAFGAAALLMVQGCAAGTVDSGENFAEVSENVAIIDQQMMNGALVEEGQIVFPAGSSDWLSTVAVGDILVSEVGNGYLRRVTNIAQEGDQIVVSTEQAPLTSAVDRAEMHQVFERGQIFDPDKAEVFDFGLDLDLGGQVLFEQDGLQVTLSEGLITFRPSVEVNLGMSWGRVNFFELIASGELDARLIVDANASRSFERSQTFERELFRTPPKVFVQMLGVLPVVEVVTAKVVANFEIQASVAGRAQAGLEASAGVEAGVVYQGGRFTPVTGSSIDLEPIGPNLNVNGQLVARASLEPRVEVLFFGVAGASLGVDAFAQLNASGNFAGDLGGIDVNADCQISLGLTGDIAAELGIIGLDDLNRELFNLGNELPCIQ